MKATLAIYGTQDKCIGIIPSFVHDHNVCIMQDGKILQYLQLERYTRRKYDNRLGSFIEGLIEDGILSLPEEFDIVCANDFLGSAFISSNGKLSIEASRQDGLSSALIPARACLSNGFERNRKVLGACCCPHELAHIFSTVPFYGEFKENSLLVSFDGASSQGNYSAFIYKGGKISLIENNWTCLGFASKLFNDNRIAFESLGAAVSEHCSVPGKLMGFASWGTYRPEIESWLKENEYFNGLVDHSAEQLTSSIEERFGKDCAILDTHNTFLQDCAATLQTIFEKAVLSKLTSLQERYHCDYLYYGGGCALNIVTNTKILERGLFKEIFIAPCCNDSGLSIGAATMVEIMKGNSIATHSPYLNNCGLDIPTQFEVDDEQVAATAECLLNGGIVGVCNGAGEVGPRALGNRSLLALPNSKTLSQRISMQVKKREWYRPVAPVMLSRLVPEVAIQKDCSLSRYMLMDFTVKEDKVSALEGVVHSNGTARIQTIGAEKENPFIYKLLTLLYEKHGIWALINTSFNAQGEPIVQTAKEAEASAYRMNLDGLVTNGVFHRLH